LHHLLHVLERAETRKQTPRGRRLLKLQRINKADSSN
jgi:hypothetical protein